MKSEKERAAFYQQHKDDPDVWGDLEEAPVATLKDGLTISVTVRFAPQDAEAIRRMARLEGRTYSEIVRTAVQRYTQPDTVRPMAGTIMLSGLKGSAPLTQGTPPPPVEFSGKKTDLETRSSGAALAAH